jgi:hypothetical protein
LELSTIQRIEQFMCDALVASPLIPLGVNVLRLADVIENEGVIQQTNNIVVRYTGSTNNVKNRIPMVFERQMTFELNMSCLNYLTTSGHDFATQLLAGAFITLNGAVPSGAYVDVIEPFTCQSESFTGLTDQSQYTYTQVYVVTIEEQLPYVALDPCVQRGDCRQLFPGLNVETKLPLGGVLDDASGSIYLPWYFGDKLPTEDYSLCDGIRWSDELTQSGDWVFVCDPETIFIKDPLNQPIYLLSNNNYTEDGRLVVTVFDQKTNEPIKEMFFCNSGRKLARYAVELWKDLVGSNGEISALASKDSTWFQGMNTGEFAVARGFPVYLFTDPLNPNGAQLYLDSGSLIGVNTSVFTQTEKGRFYYVSNSSQGKGWIKEENFELASLNSLWKLGCQLCTGQQAPPPPC